MNHKPVWTLLAGLLVGGPVLAQLNTVKLGPIRYVTHSKSDGIKGIGVPAGADAETGDATTLLFTYERKLLPNIGVELVIGLPPRVHAKATGTVAFLGDDVLSAKFVAPTVLLNYHFGTEGDAWRPYVGAGLNFTRFTGIRSSLAPQVAMSDSWGWAVQGGIDYAINPKWGLFGSAATLKVKSKLVGVGSTVLTTTIDLRPVTYQLGVTYRF